MTTITDEHIEEIMQFIRIIADISNWEYYEDYDKYGSYNVQAWNWKRYDPQYMAEQLIEKLGVDND